MPMSESEYLQHYGLDQETMDNRLNRSTEAIEGYIRLATKQRMGLIPDFVQDADDIRFWHRCELYAEELKRREREYAGSV